MQEGENLQHAQRDQQSSGKDAEVCHYCCAIAGIGCCGVSSQLHL